MSTFLADEMKVRKAKVSLIPLGDRGEALTEQQLEQLDEALGWQLEDASDWRMSTNCVEAINEVVFGWRQR